MNKETRRKKGPTPKDPTIRNQYRSIMRRVYSEKKLKALRKLCVRRSLSVMAQGKSFVRRLVEAGKDLFNTKTL